jgi:hypothetical protein
MTKLELGGIRQMEAAACPRQATGVDHEHMPQLGGGPGVQDGPVADSPGTPVASPLSRAEPGARLAVD